MHCFITNCFQSNVLLARIPSSDSHTPNTPLLGKIGHHMKMMPCLFILKVEKWFRKFIIPTLMKHLGGIGCLVYVEWLLMAFIHGGTHCMRGLLP